MITLDPIPTVVAGIAVFVFAGVYYTALDRRRAAAGPTRTDVGANAHTAGAAVRPPVGIMALELGKAIVVAGAVAVLLEGLGITDLLGAVLLAAGLWLTFPVVLLIGSVTHEGVSRTLAAIHAGDWLAKLLIVAIVSTLWP